MRVTPIVFVTALLALAACGGDEGGSDDATPTSTFEGPLLEAKLGGPRGVSCLTCHVPDGELAAPGIAGPLGVREGYWGEVLAADVDTLENAVAYCLQRFVLKTKPTGGGDHPTPANFPTPTATQKAWIATLVAEIGGGAAGPARTITFASEDEVATLDSMQADTARGEAVYRAACAACHGASGEGGFGHELAGMESPISYTVEYVRMGHEEMPPFSEQALTNQQVADVAMYVQQLK